MQDDVSQVVREPCPNLLKDAAKPKETSGHIFSFKKTSPLIIGVCGFVSTSSVQKTGHLVRSSHQKEPWRVIQIAQEQPTFI